MEIYKKLLDVNATYIERLSDHAFIPLNDPLNSSYQNFKKEISAKTAKIQNSEGVEISNKEATNFISKLP